MRTHPRPTALLAVLSLLLTLVVVMLSVSPADARQRSRSKRARAARVVAPATPENFERLRRCESGGNYAAVSRSRRYFGAYQFSLVTWTWMGYTGMPHLAPPHIQDEAAARLQSRSGWRPWPRCSRRLLKAPPPPPPPPPSEAQSQPSQPSQPPRSESRPPDNPRSSTPFSWLIPPAARNP